MMVETIIYGSGQPNTVKPDKVLDAEEAPKPDAAMAMAQRYLQNPLTAPLAPIALFLGVLQMGAGIGGPMPAREFTNYGELVQETPTSDLNRMNIFGA